jgi:hypothetical protein
MSEYRSEAEVARTNDIDVSALVQRGAVHQ